MDTISFETLEQLLGHAESAGADAADIVCAQSQSARASCRNGALEDLATGRSAVIGLRVFVGGRQAVGSTTRTDAQALESLAADLVAQARLLPVDPYAGLAEPGLLAVGGADAAAGLDLVDETVLETPALIETAQEIDAVIRGFAGVSMSEGAQASYRLSRFMLLTSAGFRGAFARTSFGRAGSAIAGEGAEMQRDGEYRAATHLADLPAAEAIGRLAAERAVRLKGAQKIASAVMPVLFDRRVAAGFVRTIGSAVAGSAVARGTSFLKDRLGEAVAAASITVRDDPLRPRGQGSRPFDGEGVASRPLEIVSEGRLARFIFDTVSARKLGMVTTGHGERGAGSLPQPSPSNLYLEAGPRPPEAMIAAIGEGLLVTRMMGAGVNLTTGDFSRGATGFRIRGGEIAEPVQEITVAGNLREMMARAEPASDLVFEGHTDAPSILIDGVTVAGS